MTFFPSSMHYRSTSSFKIRCSVYFTYVTTK